MVLMSQFDGRAYQDRFDALAESGADVHGEASLVRSFSPSSVLDAGCGTGRVAIELTRHGIDVVGVDRDASMIAEARRRAANLTWIEADLATLALGRTFDVVVLAGNVPLFCPPESRSALVNACVAHVRPGGVMLSGFQLDARYNLDEFDAACGMAGVTLVDRWGTWDRGAFRGDGGYAVSVHRR
jgi:SAM-dependent methyltransferase